MSKAQKAAAVRARHASTVKQTIDSINGFTAQTCASTLAVYREELESGWTAYHNAFIDHEDAIIGKNDDDVSTITTEFATIHTSYLRSKVHLNKLIAGTAGNTVNLDQSIMQPDGVKTVKLPPCKLMNFSGELSDWVEFKATCRSMLPDKIDDVHRLQFLKDALKGEPRELVAHILPANGAYERAMLLLKNRYENTRAIVNNHLRRLYTLPRNSRMKKTVVVCVLL